METVYTQALSVASAAICLALFVVFAYRISSHPRKTLYTPLTVPQAVPLVGHLIGILRHGFEYLEHLGAKHKLSIFTVKILGKDVHIINSPDLVVAVQKNPRIYDFSVFANTMLPRLFDLDKKTMKLASTNIEHPGGSRNLVVEINRIFHRCLSPGPSLEKMERVALPRLLCYFEELGSRTDATTLDLFAWLRSVMTVASTEAIYGPENPFSKRPQLEQAFWDWEHDLTRLLLIPAPSLFARKGYRARSKFINAMVEYLEWRGHEHASDLTKAHYRVGIAYGLSLPEIARFEIGSIMGVLVNSTPTLFWLLLHIYSDPQLLANIRVELSLGTMKTVKATSGSMQCTVDVPTLRQRFPLLASTYQETLRFHTHNSSSRMVTQDTVLMKKYRLKTGSIILMPGATIHALPSVWGEDAHQFKPRRFLRSTQDADKAKLHPGAFRSFGGGVSLCPGRHFATTEICAATAMFVSRFDMVAVDPKGAVVDWQMPAMEVGRITSSIPLPKGDVNVRVSVRKDMRDWEWEFGFKEELAV
ncbi:MAG: hypothetical protein Q9172_004540 [Xanthocarpia lactea]